MLALDAVWLVSMKNVYDKWLINFDRVFNIPAALLVYIFIPLGLFWLVISKNTTGGINSKVLVDAFVYGVCSYAVYDLTNLATLKNWPVTMTIVDILWGGTLCVLTTIVAITVLSKIS